MKRAFCLLLAAMMCLSLLGCQAASSLSGGFEKDPNVVYLLVHEIRYEGTEEFSYEAHTEYAYNDNLEFTSITMYGVFDVEGCDDGEKLVTTYSYSEEGNTKYTTMEDADDLIIFATTYDDNGKEISSYATRNGEFYSESTHEYDENGNIIYYYYNSTNQTSEYVYTYDEEGKLLSQVTTTTQGNQPVRTTEFHYEDGKLKTEIWKDGGVVTSRREYVHEGDKVTKELYYDGADNLLSTREYEYDGNNVTIWSWSEEEGTLKDAYYEYDQYGKKVYAENYYKGELLTRYTYEYKAFPAPDKK